jgi:hypothetical protein
VSGPVEHVREIVLEPVRCAAPFEAWRVGLPGFSLDPERRREAAFFVLKIVAAAGRVRGLQPRLWLDTRHLHKDRGNKLFSSHARTWAPRMGFCFDPMASPPRKLEMSDLMSMEYGSKLKLDDRSAIFISRQAQTLPAYRVMSGRGMAVLLLFRQPDSAAGAMDMDAAANRYMLHTRDQLRGAMAPGQFQNFDFYLPLLTASGVAAATVQQLALWMGEAEVYLHESVETEELIVLARSDLSGTLQSAGMRPLSVAEGRVPWGLRYDAAQESGNE